MNDMNREKPLRHRIILYMQESQRRVGGWFPTWWFKFHVGDITGTPEIRRELQRMERDGLIESDHEQSNNTKWRLICSCPGGDSSRRWNCSVHGLADGQNPRDELLVVEEGSPTV